MSEVHYSSKMNKTSQLAHGYFMWPSWKNDEYPPPPTNPPPPAHTVAQRQKAVTAYFSSKQLLPFASIEPLRADYSAPFQSQSSSSFQII